MRGKFTGKPNKFHGKNHGFLRFPVIFPLNQSSDPADRTTAMRTPSRFYKAPELVGIQKAEHRKLPKNILSHHQISHHHPSFSECSKVFPWFSQPFTSCICSGELNCILDSCNATDEIPVGYVGEAWQFQWGKWRVIWSFVGLTIPWKRKAPTSQFTEYNIDFFLLVVLFNANAKAWPMTMAQAGLKKWDDFIGSGEDARWLEVWRRLWRNACSALPGPQRFDRFDPIWPIFGEEILG